MADNIEKKPTETGDTGASARNESWLAKNTGPILAILTVLLTFLMFGYFVCLANKSPKEVVELRNVAKSLVDAETKFAQVSSSKTERAVPGKLEGVRKERDKLRIQAGYAKEASEDAKERRAMVKDFVLYILGVLSSALTTIFGYYFGSSKGSSDKNALIATQNPQQLPTDATRNAKG
jgi:hypothetical protein